MNAHSRKITATATVMTDTEKKPNLLSQKAVLAHVKIGGWSARKLDRKITDETNERHNASKDAGRYNKLLLPKESLDPMTKVLSEARGEHYRLTMAWQDNGARILPTAMYMDYMKKMRGLREQYEAEVAKFVKAYPQLVKDAPKRLGDAFDATDFPGADRIHKSFYFDISVMPCPDKEDFRVDLADEHLEDVKADMEQRMKAALDAAMKEPVERIIKVVGNMAERLKNYKPAHVTRKGAKIGAKSTFRDSLVENVRDLVSLLPSFNLTGDEALRRITIEMRDNLTTYDAEELRTDAKIRKRVADEANRILAQAEALMG